MTSLTDHINNWIAALNDQIGDTDEEIRKRQEANTEAVAIREDLLELRMYISGTDLPYGVQRALLRCLAWNPHATRPPK